MHTRSDLAGDFDRAVNLNECLDNDAYCGLAIISVLFSIGSKNNTVIDVSFYFLVNL